MIGQCFSSWGNGRKSDSGLRRSVLETRWIGVGSSLREMLSAYPLSTQAAHPAVHKSKVRLLGSILTSLYPIKSSRAKFDEPAGKIGDLC